MKKNVVALPKDSVRLKRPQGLSPLFLTLFLMLQEASSPFAVQSWVRHQHRNETMLQLFY